VTEATETVADPEEGEQPAPPPAWVLEAITAQMFGFAHCQRCGSPRLRLASARGKYAVIGCLACLYQHVRVASSLPGLLDALAAMAATADPEGATA
jgi:hypothetical protein